MSETASRHTAVAGDSGDSCRRSWARDIDYTALDALGCCRCALELSATPTSACCFLLACAYKYIVMRRRTRQKKMKIDTITSAQAALTSAQVATSRCQRLVIALMLQQVDELEGHTNATVPGEANSLGGASHIPYSGSQTSSQNWNETPAFAKYNKIAKNTTRRYTNLGMRKTDIQASSVLRIRLP